MNLSKLKVGDSFTISKINAENQLKNRFISFGIVKGVIASIEEITLAKETIEIKIKNSKIALRITEARTIEVKKC